MNWRRSRPPSRRLSWTSREATSSSRRQNPRRIGPEHECCRACERRSDCPSWRTGDAASRWSLRMDEASLCSFDSMVASGRGRGNRWGGCTRVRGRRTPLPEHERVRPRRISPPRCHVRRRRPGRCHPLPRTSRLPTGNSRLQLHPPLHRLPAPSCRREPPLPRSNE